MKHAVLAIIAIVIGLACPAAMAADATLTKKQTITLSAGKKVKTLRTKEGVISSKAARPDIQYCNSTLAHQVEEGEGTEAGVVRVTTTAHYTAPAYCWSDAMGGIWFDGEWESIDLVGEANGIAVFKMTASARVPASIVSWDVQAGDMLYAYDDQPVVFTVGRETYTAYPSGDVMLSAAVAGRSDYAERLNSSCNQSRCTPIQQSLGGGIMVLERELKLPGGTMVFNERGQAVGMILFGGSGRTVIATMSTLDQALYDLGVFERSHGKG